MWGVKILFGIPSVRSHNTLMTNAGSFMVSLRIRTVVGQPKALEEGRHKPRWYNQMLHKASLPDRLHIGFCWKQNIINVPLSKYH